MPDVQNSLLSRLTRAPLVADQKRAKALLKDFVERVREEPDAAALLEHLSDGPFFSWALPITPRSSGS